MKEILLQRIQEIRGALEQSANNHNALIGRLAEAQFMFESYLKKEQEEKQKNQESQPAECQPDCAA